MTIDRRMPPYYDDWQDAVQKGYVQICAVPGRVEQAREFSQIQSVQHKHLKDLGDVLYNNGQILSGCLATVNADKTQITISGGSVYAEGYIITFTAASVVDINGVGDEIIGVIKTESIVTEESDSSLYDPAMGYRNYGQAGAHRLKLVWTWGKIVSGVEGYETFKLADGSLPQTTAALGDPKPKSTRTDFLDAAALRDFEKSGNYVLNGLNVKVVKHPDPALKDEKLQLIVGSGKGRILGYDYNISEDWKGDFEVARVTDSITNEPWRFTQFDPITDTGGEFTLGETPVAAISDVTAPVLYVFDSQSHGGVTRPLVTHSMTPGGKDDVPSSHPVDTIIDVVQGSSITFNPVTERFEGSGLTRYQRGSDWNQSGNGISWSPAGAEPAGGSSYAVAVRLMVPLVKEIVVPDRITNQSIVHGNSANQDYLGDDNRFPCEDNLFTDFGFCLNNSNQTGEPKTDFQTAYVQDVDFEILNSGYLDWYDHDVQIIQMTKGTLNSSDVVGNGSDVPPGDFTDGFSFGEILAVAYYSNPADMSYNESARQFVSPTTTFVETTSYTYAKGVASISWAAGGPEPSTGATYFIAVRARRYKTSNHPGPGATIKANYYRWKRVVNGDYLARDSFYKEWYGAGDPDNLRQRYGLRLENSVNFWKSYSYQANTGNINRPYPNERVYVDYTYYLDRYATIEFTDDLSSNVAIIYGNSSRSPVEPVYDYSTRSISLAKVYCPADSLYPTVINTGIHTLRVSDLNTLKERVVRTETNLAKTWIDMDAKSIPVTNKKGVFTSAFHDDKAIDKGWPNVDYGIDPDWEEIGMPYTDSFYSAIVDTGASTASIYDAICTLTPNSTYQVSQPFYTGDESIAPYALANQDWLAHSPSATMTVNPMSDTVTIPRVQEFASLSDADAWMQSDVRRLSNPTQWFSKGWTTGNVAGNTASQEFTREYIRNIDGFCRQRWVDFNIPGGLITPDKVPGVDYYLYFADRMVTPTLLNGTPPGSVPGTFRAKADGSASGRFYVPVNVPEGRIQVRATSTDMTLGSTTWKHNVVTTYEASIVEQLILRTFVCRCNCWCNCNCNCWTCGRCGTGPLAETLEPVGRMRVLKDLVIDFFSVSPVYGVYANVTTTDNGVPTSANLANSVIAKKFMSPSGLAGAGEKTFSFDNPVILKDETYSFMVSGEDGFNINAVDEIVNHRDIRCKIAVLGQTDIPSGQVVGAQPFKNGVLFRSLTGITWEQDQKSDLKFRATFYEYPVNTEQIVYMQTVSAQNVTEFILNWDSEIYEGTAVVFEYRTQTDVWKEFQPYTQTSLKEIATELHFRARMTTTTPSITPMLHRNATLFARSRNTAMKVVTTNYIVDPSDTLDIYIDSHLPTSCTEAFKVTFDNGGTWTTLSGPIQGQPTGNLVEYTPVDLNVNDVKFRHHWRVQLTSPSVFTNFRLSIESASSGVDAKLKDPRFSRLILLASQA
jgi:hypothetical protein